MMKVLLPTAALAAAALAAAALATGGVPNMGMGPAAKTSVMSFQGYYDGHKDTFLSTDVSSKADAKAMHINYSAALASAAKTPAMYMVMGRAAPGQLAVFGSEPGEDDYSPIWQEVFVSWKANAKPVLLVKDDQIKSLAKQGMLKLRFTKTKLNCPIIKVGKGGS